MSPGNLWAQSCPTLVWSDEFSGTSLNLNNWEYQTGDGCDLGICGWGNNELQSYQQANITVGSGTLKITAKKERIKSKQYTSGRIRSKGLQDFTFGRMESRIKLPAGQGLWPAFWMLSTNEPDGVWPQSGEIDIMEFLGQNEAEVLGTIHYGNPAPGNQFQGNDYVKYDGTTFTQDFHVFAIEWEPTEIRWYVDNVLYSTKSPADLAPFNWPFDATNSMHFLLNLAVGGNLPGSPDNSTPFPSTMEVDYVRVYDMSGSTLEGNRLVLNQATGETYQIRNAPNGASFTWSVPADAAIASGAGTNSIQVDFGNSSGNVSCVVSSSCGSTTINSYIKVESPFSFDFSFENFDATAQVTLSSTSGSLTEVSNPDASGINPSGLVGQYQRDAASQYDVIAYTTAAISDADAYSSRDRKFYLDLYTNAPVGTPVLIQLESATANSTNYPGGRHSRYEAVTTVQNGWERLIFSFLDRPDGSVASGGVSNLLVLFAPNTFSSHTYTYDNLDSYIPGSGNPPSNQSPIVSITSPTNGATFSTLATLTITADASDSDGNVTIVTFFVDGNAVGTDNTAPYSVDWTIPANGSYSITATATDDDGASTNSSAVDITVDDGSGGVSYCTVGGGSNSEHISSIQIGSYTNSSGNDGGFGDYTAQTIALSGGTENVTLTPANTRGPVRSEYWRIWIDLNVDGDFNDPGELVFDAGSAQAGVLTGTATIPTGTVTTRMRIAMKRSSAPGPCESGYNGEIEDYTVSIGGSVRRAYVASEALIEVYPNPASTSFMLLLPEEIEAAHIQLKDLQGRTCLTTDVNTRISNHAISALPSGAYILLINHEGGFESRTIIKQ